MLVLVLLAATCTVVSNFSNESIASPDMVHKIVSNVSPVTYIKNKRYDVCSTGG